MSKFFGTSILVTLTILLSGCSFSMAGDVTPPPGSELPAPQVTSEPTVSSPVYPIVPPDLVSGKTLYDHECTPCHGEKGLGDGPQAAQLSVPVASLGLSDFARQYSPAEWYTVVSQGNMEKFMPAFTNLSDRQRWDVVAYAMTLSTPNSLIIQGKSIYESTCSSCHGISGNGHGSSSSTLAAQPADFTDQSFMAQASSARLYQAITSGIAPDMPAFTSSLDDNQRWALVSYLRLFTFADASSLTNTYPGPTANGPVQPTEAISPGSTAYPNPVSTSTPELTPTAEITSTATFTGSITVQLINGSGGTPPSDSEVTLYGFDDMQNTYSESLTTGENGVYSFNNVLMPSGRVFLAGTDYASGTYGSDIATVDPANPDLNLQITVYDSTTDISILNTDRVHVFFDFTDPQNVQVIEVFIISNPSNQAVVSSTEDGSVVTFPLPQGYSNLQFQDGSLGGRYIELSQGFADKMTVSPGVGQYQVVFAFQMPYNRQLEFVQPMFLPTSAVVVMVPDNGIKLSSSMLQDNGTSNYQNTTYRIYNGSSLIAGSSLKFSLSGTPQKAAASFFTTGSMQNLAIGLGVFGVALVAMGVWLFQRNRQKLALENISGTDGLPHSLADLGGSPEDVNTLMDAIIALDDQYHAGNLPEDAYLQRRAALKDKLRKMEQG
jgi:mono/diheme cytochrome c family protein